MSNIGKFIVMEGVDGAGKTTQIKKLAENLQKQGKRVFVTSEPTCKAQTHAPTAVGSMIDDVLKGKVKMTPSAMAALFLCDRILHNTDADFGIRKLLEDGLYVICDRYYYSSFAYQGIDSDLDWVIRQNLDCPDIARPDVCIFLELSPETAKARREARGEELEIFETDDVRADSIRDKFMLVFERMGREEVRFVLADGSIEEVAERVLLAVNEAVGD